MHPVCYLFRRHLILKSFIVILSKLSAQKWDHPTALDVDTVVTIVLGLDEMLVLAMVDVKTATSMDSVTIEITIIIRIKIKER
jgi:hypothetical protein